MLSKQINLPKNILEKLNEEDFEKENNFERNFEIIAILRDDLSICEKDYINDIIQKLMNKYNLNKDTNGIIYKEQKDRYDDFIPCSSFYLDIFEFKKYFNILEYNSYLEGVMHGSL